MEKKVKQPTKVIIPTKGSPNTPPKSNYARPTTIRNLDTKGSESRYLAKLVSNGSVIDIQHFV